ncbi:hypothetical protein PL10110_390033 [Planktothrix agardhii]|nr:hypothetical protein PL10110_390033 [Planktothrix agardhii]
MLLVSHQLSIKSTDPNHYKNLPKIEKKTGFPLDRAADSREDAYSIMGKLNLN